MKILDCTLRDGGYVNGWNFTNYQINKIIDSLECACVDIVELGYLDDKGKSKHSTLFDSLDSVNNVLGMQSKTTQKVVMIDLFSFDIDKLPLQVNTKIDGIRLAFHKKDINAALLEAEKIINLGYQLFFQPMVVKNYSDADFLSLIRKSNQLNMYAFYVVDSFGSMSLDEFRHYISLANDNLKIDVKLGYHAHNNMQLAFSNAIDLCVSDIDREVIIDSSIYGMGRGAGNLNTELIADYLNTRHQKKYNIVPLLEVIDEILVSYLKKHTWGFSPAQYLSATLNCHPNYSSYLVNKKTNNITDIKKILDQIPPDRRFSFNEQVINNLYQEFLLTSKSTAQGRLNIPKEKKLLLIASGSSINNNLTLIEQKIDSDHYLVIALNHIPPCDCDYYFFSNQQRFDEFRERIPVEKQIITTNIKAQKGNRIVVELKDVVYTAGEFITNVAVLMINYLALLKINNVEVAGLDGYQKGKNNYAYDETNVITNENLFEQLNETIGNALRILKQVINIELITESIYINKMPLRIIGIIPARYDSSRFQGKPLCLINKVPMIKRTYEQAKKSTLLDKLVVATDSSKIKHYCDKEKIPVVMTSKENLTGTDRLAEVAKGEIFDFYINIQGDEPVIDPESINQIVNEYRKHHEIYGAYALYKKISNLNEVQSEDIIKVVINKSNELVYMSRYPVPFNKLKDEVIHNKQVCVYGFTKAALEFFSSRSKTSNEQFEDIELLRFIDLGYKVKMLETTVDSIAVDTPDDVKKVECFLNENNLS